MEQMHYLYRYLRKCDYLAPFFFYIPPTDCKSAISKNCIEADSVVS